jgi:membrane associated rhomboid family serine protease
MQFNSNPLPNAIKGILIATISIYILQIIPFTGRYLLEYGALTPSRTFAHFELWRLVTYVFLHDPSMPFHLLFNMLMLWMFGLELEELWGEKRFLTFYLICGGGAGLFSLLHLFNPAFSTIPVIGASGAVLGIMTAYALYFPNRQVLLFFVLPVNIRIVIIGAVLISLFGTLSSKGFISHLTHLGGILVAFFYIKLYPMILRRSESLVQDLGKKELKKVEKTTDNTEDNDFFEKVIDPILAKISREGMDSLTNKEKALLKEASKRNKNKLRSGKIIPFDSFR